MERVYRVVLLALFVIGFIGAVAGVGHTDESIGEEKSPVASLIKDVRLAEEINDLNRGRWNQDVSDLNQDGLARIENLVGTSDSASADDSTLRAKSELND